MAHIIWAPRAFADLENLLDYIARREPATARRFGQKILERIEKLADFPESGSFVPEDDSLTYREVFKGPYRESSSETRSVASSSSRFVTALACSLLTNWRPVKVDPASLPNASAGRTTPAKYPI